MTDDPWLTAAIRAAAHAVTYLHFGHRFENIKLTQDDTGNTIGCVTAPAGRTDYRTRAICCLAGPIALEQLSRFRSAPKPPPASTLRAAREALVALGLGKRINLDRLTEFTYLLVENEWPHIARLASALVAQKELDYAAVVALLERC